VTQAEFYLLLATFFALAYGGGYLGLLLWRAAETTYCAYQAERRDRQAFLLRVARRRMREVDDSIRRARNWRQYTKPPDR
jgi:hypothetical protein